MASHIKKHFIFDLDDTLVDGRLFCGETMARTVAFFEPNVDSQAVIDLHEEIRGRTVVDLYEAAIRRFGLTTPLNLLLAKDSEIMLAESDKIRIFEGVIEILDLLRSRGKTLHICTNRKSDSLLPILRSNGLENYFDSVVSCIDAGYKKPDAKCLLDIMSRIGDDADSYIYFGDSEIDYLFAKNAGIEHIIFDQYMNGKNLFKKLIDLFLI